MSAYKLLYLNKRDLLLIVTGGFAVFAMFFGSGNLVFPLLAGKLAQGDFFLSFLGLSLTGIFVPLLGLIGILLYNGSYKEFFQQYGKITAFSLILFMVLILGPIGVLPRCITVAFGSFSILASSIPLSGFSIIMTGVVFLLCLNQNHVVPLLGAILAPAKILSVGFIVIFGLFYAKAPQESMLPASEALTDGIFKGYQMMDLVAGFFFASVIARHFSHKSEEEHLNRRHSFIMSLSSILLGASLLFVTYLALTYLGATFSLDLNCHAPEQFLSVIAHLTLGSLGGKIVTIAIILSCLTTAVALTTVFTDFLFDQIFMEKVSYPICLVITATVTILMSNLGFEGIATFLSPILYYLYPLLILLTVINIVSWYLKNKKGLKEEK